jgi:hypothetical protein
MLKSLHITALKLSSNPYLITLIENGARSQLTDFWQFSLPPGFPATLAFVQPRSRINQTS